MKLIKEQENRIAFYVFLAVMVIACSPLITKLCINGHDLDYHLLRIESLKEGIRMGKPFLKVNVLYFGGAGYASSMFYPDFLLYIPAILRVLGVGINASYHFFIAFCIVATYLSTYFCSKQMIKSSYGATIAAILMTFSPYFLGDIYIRSAVGEYTAFIFLPFVIYGIYNLLYEEMSRPQILGIGFIGILLCHTTSFLFSLVFALLACIIKWKVFAHNLKVLWKLLITAALSAFLTAPYWLSMLEQLLSNEFYVSDAWIGLEESALQLSQVFTGSFPALGFLLVILALFRILVKKNGNNRELLSYADWLLIGGAFFTLLATDIIPWNRLNGYLSFIQFPWRFFVIATAMLSFADAIILYLFLKSSLEAVLSGSIRMITILLLVVSTAFTFSFLGDADITYYDYSPDYYSYKPFTCTVIAGEWLPKGVTEPGKLVEQSEQMLTDSGNEIAFERIQNHVECELTDSYEYVDVPLIYYKGYSAFLTDQNGSKSKVSIAESPNNALCRVTLNGSKGHLLVRYDGTILQKIAIAMMIVSILVLAGMAVRKKKRILTAATLLLMLSLCGCADSNASEQEALAESTEVLPDITKDTILGETGEVIPPEPIKETYALIYRKGGYEPFDSKKIRLIALENRSEQVSITTKLLKDDTVIATNQVCVSTEDFNSPVVIMNCDDIVDQGDYMLEVSIEDEPRVILTDRLIIDAETNSNAYQSLCSQNNETEDVFKLADRLLTYLTIEENEDEDEEKSLLYEDLKEEATETFLNYREKNAGNDDRFMAATWLYQLTGESEYRQEAEEYLDQLEETKLSKNATIYYGMVGYLSAKRSVNSALSGKAMQMIFQEAIALVNTDRETEWEEFYQLSEEDRYREAQTHLHLILLANSVSHSTDYVRAAGNYLELMGSEPDSIYIAYELSQIHLFD